MGRKDAFVHVGEDRHGMDRWGRFDDAAEMGDHHAFTPTGCALHRSDANPRAEIPTTDGQPAVLAGVGIDVDVDDDTHKVATVIHHPPVDPLRGGGAH